MQPMSSPACDSPAPAATRWQGLAPVADARTRALVLGSFPGLRSLQQQQYYAHPQNQFWPLLQALWPACPQPARNDYAGRCEWLLSRGLGLWDVYASCEREGSLDSAIRAAEVNDFAGLRLSCPQLTLALHNGGGCEGCGGTGHVWDLASFLGGEDGTCPDCHGTGISDAMRGNLRALGVEE